MTRNSDQDDILRLRQELVGLFNHIRQFRRELASIRRPGCEDDDHFAKMVDQLDAIVESTEGATNTIMERMEEIDELVNATRQHVSDPQALALLDRITDKGNDIFEACSFQDLTGQRITKVVHSLKYVEERINALVRMWGPDALAAEEPKKEEIDPDKALLNGPQRAGQAVTQEQVDAMFSQDDIDKLFG
ncbi:protein phosphatase CheZ [Telmatospirillum sp. J64-1]|uniref:protein phosphatase CheZ n=1 Tax=Telmatospirillum sp. J64-1 TaxID=2502183 RepID=UPI00115C78F4|nr:protein phosphatase CheZ [Telmatospirillum sp. J64-1]